MAFSAGVSASIKASALEDALGVFEQRRGTFAQFDIVMVEPPQQRSKGDINHRKIFAEDVFAFAERRGKHGQTVADGFARFACSLLVAAGFSKTWTWLNNSFPYGTAPAGPCRA